MPCHPQIECASTDDIVLQIFVDATNPLSYINARDARATVRKLVKGFKEHGLHEGDRVCLVAYNNVSCPPTGQVRYAVRHWLDVLHRKMVGNVADVGRYGGPSCGLP